VHNIKKRSKNTNTSTLHYQGGNNHKAKMIPDLGGEESVIGKNWCKKIGVKINQNQKGK
jgi:hypothetical protein